MLLKLPVGRSRIFDLVHKTFVCGSMVVSGLALLTIGITSAEIIQGQNKKDEVEETQSVTPPLSTQSTENL